MPKSAQRVHGKSLSRRSTAVTTVAPTLCGCYPSAPDCRNTATVYALGLVLIASVYIGFAIADGRRSVLVVETSVATVFVIVAAAAVTGSPWLLVAGLAGHGLKDLWQHRRQFVANTRWWPPFCLVVDWVAATVIAVEIVAGVHFHR